METQDIRIARLEGKVQAIDTAQTAMLSKLDTVTAHQSKIIELVKSLVQDVTDIKDRLDSRPIGFVQGD